MLREVHPSEKMRSRPRIGLVRHLATDAAESSSSAAVFRGIHTITARHYPVELLPSMLRLASRERVDETWKDFLRSCDVVISSDPVRLTRMRRSLGLDFAIVYLPLGDLPRGATGLRLAFEGLRPSDLIVFTSTADREVYRRLVAGAPCGDVVIPLFVEDTLFRPLEEERRRRVRRCLDLGDDDVAFLYVGRVTAEKNVHSLVRLLDQVMRSHPSARLFVVGPVEDVHFYEFDTGPFDMRKLLHQVVDSSDRLRDNVRFLSQAHPEELVEIYGMADVYINLTLHHDENFGYTQAEAMSCGLPVICTDWGGLKDTVEQGVTGVRVPTFLGERGVQLDGIAAVAACRALAGSRGLRASMGSAGRVRVGAEFSAPVFERRWLEALARVIRREAQGDGAGELSAFGRRYHRTFYRWRPRYDGQTYDLYRGLIAPYCSALPERTPRRDDLLELCPISFVVAENAIEILDPLWPTTFPVTALQRRIVEALEEALLDDDAPNPSVLELTRRLGLAPEDDVWEEALAGLVARGVVGRRPFPASVCPESDASAAGG